jgi:hypothetical protein
LRILEVIQVPLVMGKVPLVVVSLGVFTQVNPKSPKSLIPLVFKKVLVMVE